MYLEDRSKEKNYFMIIIPIIATPFIADDVNDRLKGC